MALEQTGFRKSLHWVIFVLLLIAMVILQSSAIGMRSFWEDEAFTAQVVKDDPDSIVQRLAKDVHPPLYWLFASSWSKAFGGDEWGLKTFSLFCLGLVFVFTYKLALDLFDSQVALISVSLLVFSPLVLTYGHNARYYSLSAALSLLVVLVVNAYVETNKWLYLGVYVLSASALLYTLYIGAALLLAINIWWFIQWLRQKKKFTQFLLWSGAQIAVLLLYIPWFSTFFVISRQGHMTQRRLHAMADSICNRRQRLF